jgi:hypothetical protein
MMVRSVIRSGLRAIVGAVLAVAALAGAAGPARAVVLDDDNRLTLTLSDNTPITLIGVAGSTGTEKTKQYYYLPANLRLAARPDSTPEFLFLKFTTEARAENGGVSGGLMHFLMQWGLTLDQESDLKEKLKKVDPNATLMGAVPMEADGDAGSFQIVSATLSDNKMTTALVNSGKAPLVPGGKAAAAARLSAEGAQLLATTLEKQRSITDVSIGLNFSYTVLTPAVNATMTMDWSKLQKEGTTLNADYKRTTTGYDCGFWSCDAQYSYSYKEVKDQFDFLVQKQVIKLQFDEMLSDDRLAKVRETFLQLFLNSIAEPAPAPPPPPAAAGDDKGPNTRQGNGYVVRQSALKTSMQQGTRVISLKARLAMKKPYTIVGNLGSWYDGVRNNPQCVAAVNLNDPFYQHRDIHFILDMDAKDLFEQQANYVTINVRKKRSAGNPFEDRVTIDQNFIKDKGVNAMVTYARGEDSNPDAYEYQTQWSFRGGVVWPTNPTWIKGGWEGVTLAAPVAARSIDVESDLDAMKTAGITRITVQVHYPRLGQEVEENISVSPVRNEALVSRKIFMDRDARGYVYRLIIDSKTDGKLAMPWSAKMGDDYVYAAVPKDVLDVPTLKIEAQNAAKTIMASAKDRVLDKFNELVQGGGK